MLHVTVTHTDPGRARVVLSGDLRADGADAVRRLVSALGRRRVVVDLTEVAAADPEALAALRAAADDLAADGVVIDLRAAS